MDAYQKLLLGNRAWVTDKLAVHPDYFTRQADSQTPDFLWIGCSDSRVPAEDITGAEPGELFVHRNIANLIIHTDLNMLSVLQYAVQVLKVKHVIVCGHYNCGGVKNAMGNKDLGLINKWLRHIKDVYSYNNRELSCLEPQARYERLVELNVIDGVQNLAQTSLVQESWRKHGIPAIHGWVYDLRTGLLKELASLQPGSKLDDIYTFEPNEGPPEAGEL
jgi:carbonic anhydrase